MHVERKTIPAACVLLYLIAVLATFLVIRHRDDGVFTYTLDDPYIHLALAKNLAHGHYGINPGEASSPASSIVWPLLLVPFANRAGHVYLPLIWNVLFCSLAAWLIGRTVERWDWGVWRRHGWVGFGVRLATAWLLMVVANLVGLTFTGMEHGLQVLLTIACAVGMVEAIDGRPIPAWCLGAAVAAPLVRYENFALVVAVGVALWAQGRGRTAWAVAGASLIGPVAFSGFLLSRGLAALPSSVLVKGSAYAAPATGFVNTLVAWNAQRFRGTAPVDYVPQMALTAVLIGLMVLEKRHVPRVVLGATALAEAMHLAVGRYGWFHRYEIYALIFGGIVATAVLVEAKRVHPVLLMVALAALGWAGFRAARATRLAASNVYQQQYQMQRFESDYYKQNVALNDLGWVSYRRPAGAYVLDLWGLASPEASHRAVKDAAWLDGITREHAAGLAMIYPEWFVDVPTTWEPLAQMCITGPRMSAAFPCMEFYSTAVGDTKLLTEEMAAFARTLPPSVTITLGRHSADEY